jgi:hypothetical protein
MQISVRASSEPGHNLAPPPNPKKGNLVPASCHAHDVSSVYHHHHKLVHKKNHHHHLLQEEERRRRRKKKIALKEIWIQTQFTAVAQLILSSSFNEAYY